MSSVSSSSSSGSKPDKIDPVLRNALRYTVSAKEYKLLHRYLISRAPAVKKRTPPPPRYEAIVKSGDDYNAAAIRASLRLAVTTYGALKAWEYFTTRVLARGRVVPPKTKTSLWKSPNVRLSCSLSLILLFHRLLHRFFTRLRESLLTDQAKPFRRRNPRVSRTLTSRLAPAIGASLSGFFLGVYPSDQLRITIAIYIFTRALEFVYNGLEDRGWFKNRPWWFGSWLCMPVACGQLLHAFVFDRDCFPESYGRFILNHSPQYIQARPATYPSHLAWPSTFSIVDNLAEISRLKWPPFISPILFPNAQTLPASVRTISPITSPAHPAIKSLSCALLHPHDPSCLRTYVSYWIQAFPPVARFFALVFSAMGVLRYKAFAADPVRAVARLVKSVLRMSLFITGSIGTSWASICLFAHFLPRKVLPTQRWFLGGFLGGCWAFLERKSGRSNFLYSARLSLDSLWKVGVKHGWWRGVKNGDVLLFVASLAVVNAVYEVDPKAVSGGVVRKGLGMLRGEGWVDRAALSGGAVGSIAGDKDAEGEAKMREREIKDTGVEILDGEEEELEKRE
ncbi:hypothetical protein W97_07048 [Coniosporium apollinis CBS 100218]|uniref:Transmembrane protein 135 N-terminal domain-containing protein n=1 Tax=Coniosporium apollinis (strain CBS 100218) TaxID=1168221 RepID=R7Z124_CONA1|nr:uncharacterized protein W97_07048 [Coniosporium apollinis CBS 100218]EON67793.1 hypothetical protein W97_07048 [Coniosporium apollinis CBS 100218]